MRRGVGGAKYTVAPRQERTEPGRRQGGWLDHQVGWEKASNRKTCGNIYGSRMAVHSEKQAEESKFQL